MDIVLFIIVLSSFFSTAFFSIDIGIAQLSVYRIAVMISVFLIIMDKFAKKERTYLIKINSETQFLIFWFCYAVVSVMWVYDYKAWVKVLFFLSFAILTTFCFGNMIKKEFELKIIFFAFFCVLLIFIGFGFYEVSTGHYLFQPDPDNVGKILDMTNKRPMFITKGVNSYALVICFLFFSMFPILLSIKNIFIKIVILGTMVSCFVLIMKTGSRAVMIGLMIGCIFMVLLLSKMKRTSIFKYLLSIIILISIVIILVLSMNLWNNDLLSLGNAANSGSDTSRYNLIRSGLSYLSQTFFMGVGAGNIEYWMIHFPLYDTLGMANMHNWWVEILVAYGIPIFVMYIVFYGTVISKLIYIIKNNSNVFYQIVSISFASYLIAYIIASTSASSNMDNEWQWMIWGLIIAFIDRCQENIAVESSIAKQVHENVRLLT